MLKNSHPCRQAFCIDALERHLHALVQNNLWSRGFKITAERYVNSTRHNLDCAIRKKNNSSEPCFHYSLNSWPEKKQRFVISVKISVEIPHRAVRKFES